MTTATPDYGPCVVCGARPVRRLFNARDRDQLRCGACGVFYYWPLPTDDELKRFYDDEWAREGSQYQDNYLDPEYESINVRNNFAPRLDALAAEGFTGPILDVGCGAGTFLKTARDRGWEAHGTELGRAACERAAAEAGCPVYEGTVETVDLLAGSYGVIHASQVIEHVIRPQAFLAAAARLLRPGGALVLAAPIIDPSVYRVTGWLQRRVVPAVSGGRIQPFPWALHFPYHVFAHSTESLLRLVDDAGFDTVRVRKVPWLSFHRMNGKWRAYYHAMNAVFRVLRTGMNIDIVARKR
jgi:2-polyprenyl-3-methyl-5-hydroxy-6-metoxy-1,4-benzoquinol methylase